MQKLLYEKCFAKYKFLLKLVFSLFLLLLYSLIKENAEGSYSPCYVTTKTEFSYNGCKR